MLVIPHYLHEHKKAIGQKHRNFFYCVWLMTEFQGTCLPVIFNKLFQVIFICFTFSLFMLHPWLSCCFRSGHTQWCHSFHLVFPPFFSPAVRFPYLALVSVQTCCTYTLPNCVVCSHGSPVFLDFFLNLSKWTFKPKFIVSFDSFIGREEIVSAC